HDVYVAMGRAMAATNGYTPEQASQLYITDGAIDDWSYGVHGIFLFSFEMYPVTFEQGGFYPQDEVIPAQTVRNRAAILYLLEHAACPYEVIGKQAQHCAATPAVVTFTSIAAQDGWLLESKETSGLGGTIAAAANTTSALRVGDDNKDRQY